jgi:carboxymethylenebutenolidase
VPCRFLLYSRLGANDHSTEAPKHGGNTQVINPKLHRYVERLGPQQHDLVTEFVEYYEERQLRRRDLLERVLHITGSAAAAAGALLALGVRPVAADPLASAPFAPPRQTPPQSPFSVPATDPAVVGTDLTVRSRDGADLLAYLARPSAAGRNPVVLICHENQGLSEHFRDVARRFAKNGYVAIALDLLSRRGGTDAVPENMRGAGLGSPDQQVADFQDLLAYLRRQSFVDTARAGMIGFCLGGTVAWNMALREPTLRAVAPFYGNPSFRDELPNLRAAVLGAYGERDTNTTASGTALRPDLEAARKTFRINVYPDAGHAFFNDMRPLAGNFGYVESAATAAWRDVLAWFATYLRGAGLPATGDAAGDGQEGQDATGSSPQDDVAEPSEGDGSAPPGTEAGP